MSQENVERFRRSMDAFNRRDWDAFVALADDGIEVESRLVAMEGGYHGHEGLRCWWDDFLGAFPDYILEVEELRDLGDVTLGRMRGWGHGADSATPVVDPFWLPIRWRNGKIVWWRNCSTEAEALDAMSQQNLDLVRRAYEFFNGWGADPSLSLGGEPDFLHPEVEFHTYPNSPEAGIYRGPAAVIEYNQRLFAQFESVRIELEELLPAGDRVVVASRQHAVGRTGHTPIVVQVVEVWTIRDGLLAERHTSSTLAEALEAVGLEE